MKAIDAANFLIDLANAGDSEEDDGMTNMKLNKLLFFAQAISLQKYGKPLFDDPIEAWTHGPVVPTVYHTFKNNGRNSIPYTYGACNRADLSEQELDVLMDVYREYAKNYTAGFLRNLTHQSGTPWSLTEQGHVIPIALIRSWAVTARPSKQRKRSFPREMINNKRVNGRLVVDIDD